ncbi:MAG: polyamine ABC transporter ATP-binding protein [Gammaproteobacteria bacterium]|nr:MAG: polyamine ABC transporter ATP-binding protein [Gammaproteobacteria bacterium]UTW43365.1 polyamine ABC transporter ATP-binding protein [bacterium SCSIO 12844]
MQKNLKPLVSIRNLVKRFDDGHLACDNISLDIYPKEFFSLLGSSGSGKSTLLRMLAGFESPTEGKILLDGIDMTKVPPYDRPVNMMFQSYALFPHMSVQQNIAFGLKQDKLSSAEIQKRTDEALNLVEMTRFAKRKSHQLSGGQRQRVALARCLAKRPKLILLDEPLSALDKNLRGQMQFELVDIQEQTDSTFIMVTHDQEEAMTMSTRLGIMSEGYLEQVAPPNEIYEFPHSRLVAQFIGSSAIFEGYIASSSRTKSFIHSDEARCSFEINRGLDGVASQQIWVGIRPEKIMISKNPPEHYSRNQPINCLTGKVENIAYMGGLSTYHVRTETGRIVKSMDFNVERNADNPTWEDQVYLTWEPENIMVLYS